MAQHRATRRDANSPQAYVRQQLLADLVVHRLAVAGPAPEFSDRLRSRLLAVATVAPAAPTRARAARPVEKRQVPAWLPRLVVGGAAGVVTVAGIGVATSNALPGQPLYDAKRQVESWQLALHHGDASRGREQLAFARTRLAEVRALTQHHDLTSSGPGPLAAGSTANDDRIASTLRTMDSETRSGASHLTTAARDGDPHAATDLLAFTLAQTAALAAVRADLPTAAEPEVAASTALLADVRSTAVLLPGAVAGTGAPEVTAPNSPGGTPAATATPSPDVTATATGTSTDPTGTGGSPVTTAPPSTDATTSPATTPASAPASTDGTSPASSSATTPAHPGPTLSVSPFGLPTSAP